MKRAGRWIGGGVVGGLLVWRLTAQARVGNRSLPGGDGASPRSSAETEALSAVDLVRQVKALCEAEGMSVVLPRSWRIVHDLIARPRDHHGYAHSPVFLFRCRRYRRGEVVSHRDLRKFSSGMARRTVRPTVSVFVTTTRASVRTRELATGLGVVLMDLERLVDWGNGTDLESVLADAGAT